MDIVTDLSSQAVSFVSILQDICKNRPKTEQNHNKLEYFLRIAKELKPEIRQVCSYDRRQNISEITWISEGEDFTDESLEYFAETSIEVIKWYQKYQEDVEKYLDDRSIGALGLNSSLYEWRQGIKYILYTYPDERKELVNKIHYMPLQIILCLGGGGLCAEDQRLYQTWLPDYKLNTTSRKDIAKSDTWWDSPYQGKKRSDTAFELLVNDAGLLEQLIAENIPVPFETILNDELQEIQSVRKLRLGKGSEKHKNFEKHIFDEPKDDPASRLSDKENRDPLNRAKSMHLYGLAFSGGGIRSATFNLGILQKLAEHNLLRKFDYLSTVSGGGYIGSWLASWILRSGSISTVTDRLDPEKSADPLGEDVRPIRWLRMFSNYLSPNASIMSADAWTMGITWLRNTLINQVMLLLFLCTALFGVQLVYHGWLHILNPHHDTSWVKIGLWSIPIFIPAAIIAGYGMRAYLPGPPHSPFSRDNNKLLALILIGWGIISAFFVSSWFFSVNLNQYTIIGRALLLWPAGIVGFISLIIVASMGRYGNSDKNTPVLSWIYIVFFSALAAFAGMLLLACTWQIFGTIRNMCIANKYRNEIGFMVALPLVLETMSIIVVVRMALLGLIFPDERREWWGRVGAIAHRFILVWITVAAAVLFLPHLPEVIENTKLIPGILTTFGGWTAIVGYAVKLAFNPKTSGDTQKNGSLSAAELFVRIAPYLFALGFLIIGSCVSNMIFRQVILIDGFKMHEIYTSLGLFIIIGTITVFLSWRIGVNEFSLHHFYCNRLVRAYLGATKRRKERELTVNNFTDFNKLDDLKLTCLTNENQYSGPFMIINAALNSTVITDELDRQDRKAESFVFTSKYCGFDCSRTRSASRSAKKSYDYGYRPTKDYSEVGGPELGTAMAISGAAVNPNMGYHSSPATAFLLTIFNVRLGRWIGNPRKSTWRESDPKLGLGYLLSDLIGKSDTTADFVCLSDGGHFDDTGVYELVRRRCRYILLCDAEEDDDGSCDGLANVIRRCRIDFGAEINISLADISANPAGHSEKHFVQGTIWYPGDPSGRPSGVLTYVKPVLCGDESVDVREYAIENKQFPQQSTGDQFFDESQFESYRELGYCSLEKKNKTAS